ncbi:MAG: hypothetical protein LBR75_02025, partial [Prevotellaceae bacterium]|nr:hypothetical protein [Prevotellaceae bacterium]
MTTLFHAYQDSSQTPSVIALNNVNELSNILIICILFGNFVSILRLHAYTLTRLHAYTLTRLHAYTL